MITIKDSMFLFFIGMAILGTCGKASSQEKITIDLQKKGVTISPSMYGVFFEEINHAGDGGPYAELVQNRSFEDGEVPKGFHFDGKKLIPPPVKNHLTGEANKIEDKKLRYNADPFRGWHLECQDSVAANMRITKDRPRFETAPNNAEITIHNAVQEVALVNNGYWGMGIEAGGKYKLRTIIRVSANYKGSVQARLLSEKGKVLASCPIKVSKPDEWCDVNEILISTEKDAKARLSIVFDAPGKVWLDYVSLFPEATFNGRANGLRKDIAQMGWAAGYREVCIDKLEFDSEGNIILVKPIL